MADNETRAETAKKWLERLRQHLPDLTYHQLEELHDAVNDRFDELAENDCAEEEGEG